MKPTIQHTGLLASAFLLLTVSGSALAGEPVRKDADAGRPMPMREHRDPAARADHLRTLLQLRPDQEPALKAFLDATKPPERDGAQRPDGQPPKPLTTPERLDLQAKRMAEHQAVFQKHAAATRAFYGQLTPGQQKVFDTLRPGGGRHMKFMRRGGPGGPMMGGPDGGPPPPGGMAWMDGEGVDLALLDDQDIEPEAFIAGDDD